LISKELLDNIDVQLNACVRQRQYIDRLFAEIQKHSDVAAAIMKGPAEHLVMPLMLKAFLG
jgi:hypothetical protein